MKSGSCFKIVVIGGLSFGLFHGTTVLGGASLETSESRELADRGPEDKPLSFIEGHIFRIDDGDYVSEVPFSTFARSRIQWRNATAAPEIFRGKSRLFRSERRYTVFYEKREIQDGENILREAILAPEQKQILKRIEAGLPRP